MPPCIHHIIHRYYVSINYGLIKIMDPHNDQLQVGLTAQLVEHYTGNSSAESEKYNFFSTGLITNCFFCSFVVVVENAWYSGHYFLFQLCFIWHSVSALLCLLMYSVLADSGHPDRIWSMLWSYRLNNRQSGLVPSLMILWYGGILWS